MQEHKNADLRVHDEDSNTRTTLDHKKDKQKVNEKPTSISPPMPWSNRKSASIDKSSKNETALIR